MVDLVVKRAELRATLGRILGLLMAPRMAGQTTNAGGKSAAGGGLKLLGSKGLNGSGKTGATLSLLQGKVGGKITQSPPANTSQKPSKKPRPIKSGKSR
jgi:hypothetical protein